jgi:hypothetical protein
MHPVLSYQLVNSCVRMQLLLLSRLHSGVPNHNHAYFYNRGTRLIQALAVSASDLIILEIALSVA